MYHVARIDIFFSDLLMYILKEWYLSTVASKAEIEDVSGVIENEYRYIFFTERNSYLQRRIASDSFGVH